MGTSWTNYGAVDRHDASSCTSPYYETLAYTSGSFYAAMTADDANYVTWEVQNGDDYRYLYCSGFTDFHSAIPYPNHYITNVRVDYRFSILSSWADDEIDDVQLCFKWSSGGSGYVGGSLGDVIKDTEYAGSLYCTDSNLLDNLNNHLYYMNEIYWVVHMHYGIGTSTVQLDYLNFHYEYEYAVVPGVPQNLTATPSSTSVTLNWVPPASDGGAAITSYRIYNQYTSIGTTTGTSYTVSSLTPGTTYIFRVAAINSIGTGPLTGVSVTTLRVPYPITNLAFTPLANQIRLTWSAPANGGSPITTYRIFRDGSLFTSTTALTYTNTGVGQGVFHNYTVAAVNAIGQASQSNLAQAHSLGAPLAPSINASTRGIRSIAVGWNTPYNMGDAIQSYKVYFENGTPFQTFGPGIHSCNLTSLLTNTTYGLYITAINSLGEGSPSAINRTRTFDVAQAPVTLPGTRGIRSVTFAWNEPAFTEGLPVTGYELFVDGVFNISVSGGELSHNFTGLGNNETHEYRVRAITATGKGSLSAINTMRTFDVAQAPVTLPGTRGIRSATFEWNEPAFTEGLPVTGYELFVDGVFNISASGDELSHNFTGFGNNETHEYRVRAITAVGAGLLSPSCSIATMAIPGMPSLVAIAGALKQVNLTWAAPGSDGGTPIAGYRVYRDGSSIGMVSSSTRSYVDIGLDDGTTHTYQVAAFNIIGESLPSLTMSAITFDKPGYPVSLQATTGIRQITIIWQAPAVSGGTPVTAFRIYKDGALIIEVLASQLTYTDTNVGGIETHVYHVTAVNVVGESVPSGSIRATSQGTFLDQFSKDGYLYYILAGCFGLFIAIGVSAARKKKVALTTGKNATRSKKKPIPYVSPTPQDVGSKPQDRSDAAVQIATTSTSPPIPYVNPTPQDVESKPQDRSDAAGRTAGTSTNTSPASQEDSEPTIIDESINPISSSTTAIMFCAACMKRILVRAPVDLETATCGTCYSPIARVVACPHCNAELFINKNTLLAASGGELRCGNCNSLFSFNL